MKIDFSKAEPSAQDIQHIEYTIKGVFKIYCGIINGATWLACLEAHDKMKGHPLFKKRIKGGYTVEQYFKRVFKEFGNYERNVIYSEPFHFYRLSELPPEYRKCFNNISDREYYELWSAVGAKMYEKTYPFVSCLANKFKLPLVARNEKDADIIGWLLTASTCLRIADSVFSHVVCDIANISGFSKNKMYGLFKDSSLTKVYKQWLSAAKTLYADLEVSIDNIESSNIVNGIEDLTNRWTSRSIIFDSITDVFQNYDEVWRTPGEQKRALKIVRELIDQMNDLVFEKVIVTNNKGKQHD